MSSAGLVFTVHELKLHESFFEMGFLPFRDTFCQRGEICGGCEHLSAVGRNDIVNFCGIASFANYILYTRIL